MATLTTFQRAVLGIIELDAELSAADVARALGVSAPRVQRTMRLLVDRGILIGRTAVVDVARLGFVEYGINLQVAARSRTEHERFLRALSKSRSVSWIAEVGGRYDLMVNVIARRPHDVIEVFDRVHTEFPRCITGKQHCQRTLRARFPRGWLRSSRDRKPVFLMGDAPADESADETDARILHVLGDSTLESHRDFARAAGVSITSYLRRIERLKAAGVLKGFGWRMNLDLLGMHQYRILLSVRAASRELRERMLRFAGRQGAIKLVVECLGNWDYEFEIDVAKPEDVKEATAAVHAEFGEAILEVTALPIFSHRKYISFPVPQQGREVGSQQ
jgi:DNA-binding Lrp family transcriptional regulator